MMTGMTTWCRTLAQVVKLDFVHVFGRDDALVMVKWNKLTAQ